MLINSTIAAAAAAASAAVHEGLSLRKIIIIIIIISIELNTNVSFSLYFCFRSFIADSESTEAGAIQDILTCGSCQKTFALADIVKFIQHKVLQCNKENYGQCFPQGIF